MIAPGEKPQALRRFVEQFRLRQDAAADGDNRIGGDDVGAFELLVDAHHGERSLGLQARQPRRASTRQLARFGVSSMSAGRSASGSMPAWLMSDSRRGEPEASTSFGRPII